MLLSATSAAYIPRCYNMDLHLEAQCHLVHSDPLPPALVSLSPYRAKSGLSRQLSPIARVHSHPVVLQSSPDAEVLTPSSAAAVAAAIRRASPSSPVEFTRRVEKQGGLVLPSSDFQRICFDQLALFRMVVDPNVILSQVYVRPAGNYVMDQLELRCVSNYPTTDMSEGADCVILVGNFSVPASLQAVEAALLKQQAEVISESRAIVLPMVKHPFVVGFLVAELPKMNLATSDNLDNVQKDVPFYSSDDGTLPNTPYSNKKPLEIQTFREDLTKACEQFTTEKRSRAIMISRSLATAYVMDQKGMLLQQSSWQNNVRMNHLIEQIRGPLSSIRALTKMLSVHIKRSEISYDIIEDLLVQGDHMKDALQQLQDSVYLTKVNIARCNEETLKKTLDLKSSHPELLRSLPSDNGSSVINTYSSQKELLPLSLSSGKKDLEMPMPPLWLVPLQQNSIRPCIVSDILEDLVGVALPLAIRQQRGLELNELSQFLEVAVEESSLRQALSNLIEGALLRTQIGGKVQIYAAEAPAGGALVIIDDDGPDMHYMTQMRSLAPFGAELVSEENYGCIVRVNSPRIPDAAFSTGGTRIEIWFPALQSNSMDQVEQL
ncbi:chloroplast sensor kinase, chloroplastic-like isoform X3 [Zingiber officinale]|uniref:chloroplast sensor kinase, chloroplastic-like isoform X3 n=1 Tax=Zingiber officinale TaxID=94328 RepID=UPI001C4D284E|nr:chloroplast sensor kinase, chloroplastic-like isoform X3 [Zingiber officinale]